jgi:DNA-binding LacI/PurR family transcriptional regulator
MPSADPISFRPNCAKILAAARSVNYPGPNPAARMLMSGFANAIALVYADPLYHAFEDPATSAFVGGTPRFKVRP